MDDRETKLCKLIEKVIVCLKKGEYHKSQEDALKIIVNGLEEIYKK